MGEPKVATQNTDRPIADYAVLSDCNTAALVSGSGSIDWLCLPRFDAPSVFARLLDARAGHWSITPSGPYEMRRRYLPETLVLETTFSTPSGAATVTDALMFADGERGHDIGSNVPHVLVRVVDGLEGEVALDVDFAPRPEYGVVFPRVRAVAGGVTSRGGASQLTLSGPPPTTTDDDGARWDLTLAAGDRAAFALQWSDTAQPLSAPWPAETIEARLESTISAWRSWSELHQRYDGPWADAVRHSGRVLQALTYQPTGAIVAAPTTSLPETPGGGRNWDYRYAWIRDASLTMQALWVAACPDEAAAFVGFVLAASGAGVLRGAGIQIMFGIGGEHDLTERELPHLEGWRASRPVRIGNGAWEQVQHDIYGTLLDAVFRFQDQLGHVDDTTAQFLGDIADIAARVWRQPDQGLWEMRGPPRHFVHSKLMCWVALDRAGRLAGQLGLDGRAAAWAEEAGAIRAALLDEGWNEKVGAYTQSFGSEELDSSVLLMAMTGFLPASDPRMRSTIEAVAERLSAPGGLLYRYSGEDGLEGAEAPFLLCSYWLAECWALAGELERAHRVFEQTTAYANDVCLLAEEADPATGELMGNYPQAFSHIGLVNAAWAIAQAERGLEP
jgi:alpha,alpha-trehalase